MIAIPPRVILFVAMAVSLGCATPPPLPSGTPPSDFLFIFTQERPGGTQVTGAGAAETEGSATPTQVRVTLDAAGRVEVAATYQVPHRHVQESIVTLGSGQLRSLYELIRETDFYPMQDQWEGEDAAIGRETWFVLGNTRSKMVTVVGCKVPVLSTVRAAVLAQVPSLVAAPDDAKIRVVMDTRTNVFHAFDDPHVESIPRASRRQYPHQWAALNDGGQPCPAFGSGATK